MVIYTGCPDQIVQNLKTIILQEKSFDCLLFYYKLIVYVCYHSRIDFSHLKNIVKEKLILSGGSMIKARWNIFFLIDTDKSMTNEDS